MLLYFKPDADAFSTYSGPKLTSPFAGLYSAPMLSTHKLTNRSPTKTQLVCVPDVRQLVSPLPVNQRQRARGTLASSS